MRKTPIVTGEYYHIFDRSIAGYQIFNDATDYQRMMDIIELFNFKDFKKSYSHFAQLSDDVKMSIKNDLMKSSPKIVRIIAYCLMPTHFHLILKQNIDNGITIFMARVLNSYSRYFNTRHKRKGPLWESHFNNVLLDTDELILHVTRYIHLNAVTAKLVDRSEDWPYSSYHEYIDRKNEKIKLCDFDGLFNFTPKKYQKFVNDQIGYQRELAKIKYLIIEDYSG